MGRTANSNQITRDYLDSLLIETRYMNSSVPSTEYEIFGEKFSSPIMTAALSHLDHFMFEGAAKAFAKGAKDAGVLMWYGMASEEEIEALEREIEKNRSRRNVRRAVNPRHEYDR